MLSKDLLIAPGSSEQTISLGGRQPSERKGKRVNYDDLKNVVKAEPFEPARLRLTNGASYDLTHPDGILLTERYAGIAVGDQIRLIALRHIVEIEPLPTTSR